MQFKHIISVVNIQMEEGSEAYTSYSEYDNVYADQHYEEQTTPSNGGGSGPSNGAGGPNIQLKGLVCPMCQNVCHDVPSLKMHMSTAHGAGLAKEEESPQKQKPPRWIYNWPNICWFMLAIIDEFCYPQEKPEASKQQPCNGTVWRATTTGHPWRRGK